MESPSITVRRRKAKARERLLEAGFRLFSSRSIESVNLTEIAESAHIGIVTLYRYVKTKPGLAIEIATKKWLDYYDEVEKVYALRHGELMTAAEELEFFIDSIIELYRNHKDLLRFNRNFDTYVKHKGCTAEQMRPYNASVNVFARKFHTVYRKAQEDGTLEVRIPEDRFFVSTLYTVLSVAGKYAEGLVYPPEELSDMTEELLMLKDMILAGYAKKSGS
jgi:AcrR family transcriptional regulator